MILLMGIAGSGKGTQGKMLADKQGIHLISMGDIVRMYVTGEQRTRMLAGELLDDQAIIKIVDKVLSTLPDDEEVLIDGFPRTIPQAEWLLQQAKTDRLKLNLAVHLVASQQAVKNRLIKRARIDDQEDAIEARFKEYERATQPLIKWLEAHGVKVVEIDAEQSVEAVHEELIGLLKVADTI
jgi:adenylate kinase